jgi:hypothetical protein
MIDRRLRGASLAVLGSVLLALGACATTGTASPGAGASTETKPPEPLAPGLDYAANHDP